VSKEGIYFIPTSPTQLLLLASTMPIHMVHENYVFLQQWVLQRFTPETLWSIYEEEEDCDEAIVTVTNCFSLQDSSSSSSSFSSL